jgi:uncharacterized MAPEG superfamily protein
MSQLDDMIIEVKLYYHESFEAMESISINKLKYLFDKALARIERERKANANPSATPSTTQTTPNETEAERNKRIIMARLAQQKLEAQQAGGRNVRYD